MMTVGGFDLSTIGFLIAPGGRKIPRLGGERTATLEIPGAPRAVRIGGRIESGVLSVDGSIIRPTHADLLTALDTLAEQLQGGEKTLRFPDITDREWCGRYQQGNGVLEAPRFVSATLAGVSLQFLLEDVRARAQAETVTAGANPALVLGTASSPLRITITNGAGAPDLTAVTVRVRAGTVIRRELVWTGALAAGSALVIDAETGSVAAAGANAIAGLSAASAFPEADPAEGADNVLITPTGGGTITYETRYRRRWW